MSSPIEQGDLGLDLGLDQGLSDSLGLDMNFVEELRADVFEGCSTDNEDEGTPRLVVDLPQGSQSQPTSQPNSQARSQPHSQPLSETLSQPISKPFHHHSQPDTQTNSNNNSQPRGQINTQPASQSTSYPPPTSNSQSHSQPQSQPISLYSADSGLSPDLEDCTPSQELTQADIDWVDYYSPSANSTSHEEHFTKSETRRVFYSPNFSEMTNDQINFTETLAQNQKQSESQAQTYVESTSNRVRTNGSSNEASPTYPVRGLTPSMRPSNQFVDTQGPESNRMSRAPSRSYHSERSTPYPLLLYPKYSKANSPTFPPIHEPNWISHFQTQTQTLTQTQTKIRSTNSTIQGQNQNQNQVQIQLQAQALAQGPPYYAQYSPNLCQQWCPCRLPQPQQHGNHWVVNNQYLGIPYSTSRSATPENRYDRYYVRPPSSPSPGQSMPSLNGQNGTASQGMLTVSPAVVAATHQKVKVAEAGDGRMSEMSEMRPKHFEMKSLAIGCFQTHVIPDNQRYVAKFKVVFAKQRLIYEFPYPVDGQEAALIEGKPRRFLPYALIVPFSTITALNIYGDRVLLTVNRVPRLLSSDANSGQHVVFITSPIDPSKGEIKNYTLHQIELKPKQTDRFKSCLLNFNRNFFASLFGVMIDANPLRYRVSDLQEPEEGGEQKVYTRVKGLKTLASSSL